MRIGLLGGTFNPVHLGHLLLAEGAQEALKLDQVIWIPTRLPPHKSVPEEISPEERADLVQLAIQDHPAFRLSRLELGRPPPSYTIDTIRQLQAGSAEGSTNWFFLIGSDNVKTITTWRQFDQLVKLVQFVVVPRPGHPPVNLPSGIRWVDVKTLGISASEIRQRIREGRSIRYLVPEPVRLAIEQRGLYRS